MCLSTYSRYYRYRYYRDNVTLFEKCQRNKCVHVCVPVSRIVVMGHGWSCEFSRIFANFQKQISRIFWEKTFRKFKSSDTLIIKRSFSNFPVWRITRKFSFSLWKVIYSEINWNIPIFHREGGWETNFRKLFRLFYELNVFVMLLNNFVT